MVNNHQFSDVVFICGDGQRLYLSTFSFCFHFFPLFLPRSLIYSSFGGRKSLIYFDEMLRHAHKVILCSASSLMRRLFHVKHNGTPLNPSSSSVFSLSLSLSLSLLVPPCLFYLLMRFLIGDKAFIDHELVSSGGHQAFQNIFEETNQDGVEVTEVTLAPSVAAKISPLSLLSSPPPPPPLSFSLSLMTWQIFTRVLEFWYAGITHIADKKDFVSETIDAANIYECEHLVQICDNIRNDMSELNPSIGRLGERGEREVRGERRGENENSRLMLHRNLAERWTRRNS